ncbi:MAG: GNAT family protein [Pseudomonadota bacterium]
MSPRVPLTDRLPGETALDGHHVRLLPLQWPEPAGALCRLMAEEREELWTYMLWGPFSSPKDAEIALRERQETGNTMAIVAPTGEVMGTASFLRIRPEHGSAELGSIVYGQAMQRSLAGTEAMFLMMRHLFDDLGYRRCEWKCNAENDRSFRAAERLGFTFEGVHRQDMMAKGTNRDTAWFSLLDKEWPERSRALSAWLDPSNRDETGRQRLPLSAFMDGTSSTPPI